LSSYEQTFFFCKCREEHFIVTTSQIVKKKIVLLKKNFTFETAHLFISLWSLSGKNLLFRTKLDLCTAVDNFPVIAPLPNREIRLFCRSFETIMKIASGMLSRNRTVIVWWRCSENGWRF